MKKPNVVGMVLCKEFRVDPVRRETSLAGLFHSLHFSKFPAEITEFKVYSALHDGVGEGTMEVVICRLETEQDIARVRSWCILPGREMILNVVLTMKRCRFPAPGRYRLTLKFDHQELAVRFLDVFPSTR